MTVFLRPQEDIEARQMEWANLKCRSAAYSGSWPEWVDGVLVPSWGDIDRFRVQVAHIVQRSVPRSLM